MSFYNKNDILLPITNWSHTDYSVLVNNDLGYVSYDELFWVFDSEEKMERFKKLIDYK